jgi:predicted peptidase
MFREMKPFPFWMVAVIVALTTVVATRSPTPRSSQSLPPERLQDDIAGFSARVYTAGGVTMRYRLFVPEGLDPQKQYPLVVWLHGAGGIGVDNFRQLADDQVPGSQTWTEPANEMKHPAFVLAPQSSVGWRAQPQSRRPNSLGPPLRTVVAILDVLSRQYRIDQKRIYVAGQSDGGYAVWDLISNRPDRFAAAIVLCGGGDPARAGRLVNLPIWVFHGSADPMVPVSEARNMIQAIQKAGGKPRYTEYKGAGHEIWSRVFAEPELVDWVFAQHL